jgi:hypothetical protein
MTPTTRASSGSPATLISRSDCASPPAGAGRSRWGRVRHRRPTHHHQDSGCTPQANRSTPGPSGSTEPLNRRDPHLRVRSAGCRVGGRSWGRMPSGGRGG